MTGYISFILCKNLPTQAFKGDEGINMVDTFWNLKWELLL